MDVIGRASLAELGIRIRAWRRFRRRTQAEVAAAVGVTQASISNYERGSRDVTISTLLGVAHYLGVPLAELLTEQPPSTALRNGVTAHGQHPRSWVVQSR